MELEVSNIESIQTLVNTQNEQVLRLLNVVQDVSPKLFGTDALKTSKGKQENLFHCLTLAWRRCGHFYHVYRMN